MAEKDGLHGDDRHTSGNYIDWLMQLDPLELSAQNIDDIILINRRHRLIAESGVKVKKGPGPAIDLAKIGLVAPKIEPKKRRLF